MKSNILIFLLFFAYSSSYSQLDSLYLKLATTKDNPEIYNHIAREYWYRNNDSIIHYAEKALSIAQEKQDSIQIATAFLNLGVGKHARGNYTFALDFFIKSYDIAKNTDDFSLKNSSLSQIAMVYDASENYEMALKYYNEAYIVAEKHSQERSIMATLNNIGIVLLKQGNHEKALKTYLQALVIAKDNNYPELTIITTSNIGDVYEKQGEYIAALNNYKKALQIAEDIDALGLIGYLYLNIGNVNIYIPNFTEANIFLKKTLAIAEKTKDTNLLKEYYKSSSLLYQKTNEYEKAFYHINQYNNIKDSIFSKDLHDKIMNLEMELETEKHKIENQILQTKLELKQKENIYSVSIIIILLLSLIFYITRAVKIKKLNKKLKIKNQEILEQTELAKKRFEELQKNEQKINHLKLKQIESEKALLEKSNQELSRDITLRTLNQVEEEKRNEQIVELLSKAIFNINRDSEESKKILKSIQTDFKKNQTNLSWDEFEYRFKNIHPDFYSKLLTDFPELTQNELKLCALLSLNLTTKEIASLLHKSPQTLNVARTRLRKKLSITNTEENLFNFFNKYQ